MAVFNFDKKKELKGVFSQTKDIKRLLGELELYTTVPIIAGETLLFFDEIQDCKEALNTLKYFREYLRMANPRLMEQMEARLTGMEPLPEILYRISSNMWTVRIFRVFVRYGAASRLNCRRRTRSSYSVLYASMIYRIYCTEKPELPMKHYEDLTAFKIYSLDQAVLRSMAELPPEAVLAKGDILKEFKGAMAENFVLGSLLAQGFKTPHHWTFPHLPLRLAQ